METRNSSAKQQEWETKVTAALTRVQNLAKRGGLTRAEYDEQARTIHAAAEAYPNAFGRLIETIQFYSPEIKR
jgi:L-lysine 2,3-aminomutase